MEAVAKEDARPRPHPLDAGYVPIVFKIGDEGIVRTVQVQLKEAFRRCLLVTSRVLSQQVTSSDTPIGQQVEEGTEFRACKASVDGDAVRDAPVTVDMHG